MVDFSVLKAPNYLELYQKSFDTGKARAREDGVQNVLKQSMGDLVGAEKDLIAMGAFDEAHQIRAIRVDQARQRAAKAAKSLNFDEAANAMSEAGDVAGAEQMAGRGRQVTTGTMAAEGDLSGAREASLKAGDFDTAAAVEKMSDGEKAQAAERSDTVASIAQKLRADVPYEKRKAALESLAPALLQRGFTQEQVDGFLSADPTDENLDAAVASAMSLKEQLAAPKRALDEEAIRALIEQRRASAEKSRRPPAARSGSGSGVPPLPDGFVIEK